MPRPSSESWRTISRLLDEALDLPPDGRAAWLSSLHRRDPAVAADVAAWLREFDEMDGTAFLQDPRAQASARTALVGLDVGPYRLIEPIGHGGMGTVWLAERRDGQFEQRAAVKMLNAAQLNDAGTERFAREASILARLTHPNLAHVIDAGVSSLGTPYLVLEYVQGQHIDRHCDASGSSVRDRLRLFLDVLAPVAHAHANLVVHRDLKPANVLVTPEGHVKLLDFGIAKLLQAEQNGLTAAATQDVPLTPAFAAPEQLTGGAITTATDVYALGVLLYQLLTGRHPVAEEAGSPAALMQAILEREPALPSAAVRQLASTDPDRASATAAARSTTLPRLCSVLAGDLDTIVATALKKHPAERYATVMALADDVRRYLRSEPIGARPDTLVYRVTKFANRHRAAVTLAAVALLALVGGLVGTITQARRATAQAVAAGRERVRADQGAAEATAQRDFARRQLVRTEAINDLNAFLLADAAPLGSTFTARDLLARAEHIVQRQENDEDGTRVESLVAIGRLYNLLGETAKAITLLREAHSLGAAASDPSLRAKASCELGNAVAKTGDFTEARQFIETGLEQLPDQPQFALARVLCQLSAAGTERWAGNGDVAVVHTAAAGALAGGTGVSSPLLSLRITMDLAESYRIAGRYAEANETFADAHARLVALGREDTERAGTLLNNWGLVLSSLGRPRDAEQMLRRSIAISSSAGSDESIDPISWANLGGVLFDLAQYDDAVDLADRAYRKALAQRDNVVADQALLLGARLRVARGDVDRGEAMLDTVEAHFTAMFPPTHPAFVAVALDRSRLAEARGDLEAAGAAADHGLAIADGDTRRRSYLPQILRRRAEIGVKRQRFADARADAERSIALALERVPSGSLVGGVGLAYIALGEAHAGEGRHGEARAALENAVTHLVGTVGAEHPATRRARTLLARM